MEQNVQRQARNRLADKMRGHLHCNCELDEKTRSAAEQAPIKFLVCLSAL